MAQSPLDMFKDAINGDKSPLGIGLFIAGALLVLAGAIKGAVIGYYDNELIPFVIIPLLLGAALLFVSSKLDEWNGK